MEKRKMQETGANNLFHIGFVQKKMKTKKLMVEDGFAFYCCYLILHCLNFFFEMESRSVTQAGV